VRARTGPRVARLRWLLEAAAVAVAVAVAVAEAAAAVREGAGADPGEGAEGRRLRAAKPSSKGSSAVGHVGPAREGWRP
jgi:hypothetical protein